jgi:hypothetical protein
MTEALSKRNLMLYAAGGAAALMAAGCTQQQVSNVEAQVANMINAVQAGVVAGCQAFGKLVPTANSVIAVLAGIAGSTNPMIVTTAMVLQAVSEIVGQACAAPQPAPAPSPAPTAVAPKAVNVLNGKVPVIFY